MVELDAQVLERLSAYVAHFMADFGLIVRRYWAEVYLQGLFLDGERKSIQPLAQRVTVPGWSGDTMQALQQFVNQSPWDEQAVLRTYRRLLAASLADPRGVIVIDDTGFAKKGRHSVGVARQYSGTLGKTDNCQVAVSLHYVAPLGDYPLGLRLFLPEEWTKQAERLRSVGVPLTERAPRTKGEIALAVLDVVRGVRLPHQAVVADAGYGASGEFRRALDKRGERYVVGVNGQEVVFRRAPKWEVRTAAVLRGRPASRWYLTEQTPATHQHQTAGRAPEADVVQLARGHQRCLGSRVCLGPCVAGPRLAVRTCRPGRPEPQSRGALVAGRMAAGWFDSLRAVQSASPQHPGAGSQPVEDALARRAGLSTVERGTRSGPLRRALLVGLPPPCDAVLPGIRVSGTGAVARHAH